MNNNVVVKKVQYPRVNADVQWSMEPMVLRDSMKVTPEYIERFNSDGQATGHKLIEDREATEKMRLDFSAMLESRKHNAIKQAALHKEGLLSALGGGIAPAIALESTVLESAEIKAINSKTMEKLAKAEIETKELKAQLKEAQKSNKKN